MKQSPPGIFRSVLLSSTPSDWQRESVCANSVIPPRSCYDRSPHTHTVFSPLPVLPIQLFLLHTHTHTHTHTQSLAPPYLSFPHLYLCWSVWNTCGLFITEILLPLSPIGCVFFPYLFRAHTHTRIWGRGGENQADYKASLIWLRHRGNFLSLLLSPLHRSLPLSPLMVTEKVTEEQRLWLVQLRHRWAGQTQAKVIRYLAQDLPAPALSAVNALTSYSCRSYCFGLA